MILDLDDERCTDPAIAGAKGAGLARARQAGLPVLPGVVVAASASLAALARGSTALRTRGSGGARTVVAGLPFEAALRDALASAVAGLGERLIVRSSSTLEGDGAWAGAFTSYQAIEISDLDVAVRGCWASAFGLAALAHSEAAGLEPGSAAMAVLVQPSVEPAFGGVARLAGDAVVIDAVLGSPASLVQGHEAGVTLRVAADGTIQGTLGLELLGPSLAWRVAVSLLGARAKVGATACEWAALADGTVLLLQVSTAPLVPGLPALVVPDALRGPDAVQLARLVRRSPGPLGEALVLPWAVGAPLDHGRTGDRDEAVKPADLPPAVALRHAKTAAADLASTVWRAPPGDALRAAARTLRAVRGTGPGPALAVLADLRAPDPVLAGRLDALLARVRIGLVEVGEVADADTAWYVDPGRAAEVLAGRSTPGRTRIGVDRWEPFSTAIVLGTGVATNGVAAAPGFGSGRLRYIGDPGRDLGTRPRDVIVVKQPVPSLGALLWDAAGLIALGGGPAAHLFEAARSVGVPAICGADMTSLLAEPLDVADGRYMVAVDGLTGVVAVTPW